MPIYFLDKKRFLLFILLSLNSLSISLSRSEPIRKAHIPPGREVSSRASVNAVSNISVSPAPYLRLILASDTRQALFVALLERAYVPDSSSSSIRSALKVSLITSSVSISPIVISRLTEAASAAERRECKRRISLSRDSLSSPLRLRARSHKTASSVLESSLDKMSMKL